MANGLIFNVKCVVSILLFKHCIIATDDIYTVHARNPFVVQDVIALESSRFKRQAIRDTNTTQTTSTTTQLPNSTLKVTQETTNVTVQTTTEPTSTTPDLSEYNYFHDDHNYYRSLMVTTANVLYIQDYWVDLSDSDVHDTLSESHRTAVTTSLKFQFPFYGHLINNVTIATGGFLYISPFIHKFLTATQYIAPLMANFDTKAGGKNSSVVFKEVGKKFAVEWRNVYLQDQNASGPFHFQVVLHTNGSIHFLYKKLPIPIPNISSLSHPVKIGLSDAFYVDSSDSVVAGTKRRTIYEYHRVVLNTTLIREGTIVFIDPQPTCNQYNNCESCVTSDINFDCRWCGIVNRCSDSIDWKRQEWLDEGCARLSGNGSCSLIPNRKAESSIHEDSNSTKNGIIIIVVFIIVTIFVAIGGWLYYAYTHPTSASGIWLMENRPSQLKGKLANMKFWKKNDCAGDKYTPEETA